MEDFHKLLRIFRVNIIHIFLEIGFKNPMHFRIELKFIFRFVPLIVSLIFKQRNENLSFEKFIVEISNKFTIHYQAIFLSILKKVCHRSEDNTNFTRIFLALLTWLGCFLLLYIRHINRLWIRVIIILMLLALLADFMWLITAYFITENWLVVVVDIFLGEGIVLFDGARMVFWFIFKHYFVVDWWV